MSEEAHLREMLATLAKSLFDRGFSVGSAGNISVACGDDLLITPTNSCLGFLDPARMSKISRDGRHLAGDKPSKEVFLHQAFYATRPGTGAVVHLHSTYATLVSCLADTDPDDCIPALTPYVVMRVGRVKLLPFVPPGDPAMGTRISALEGRYAAVLLANHGPVVAGQDLPSAVYAAEELEETAKLVVLSRNLAVRTLDQQQIQDLETRFSLR
jgi:ribulose-5-phosphate 4-epimerase/fuculose-1-phosphate aldolase